MNLVLTTAGSESSWNAVEEDEAAAVDRSRHRCRGEERASDEEASARAAGRNKEEAVELCVLLARSACRPRSRALRIAVAVVVVVIMMMMMMMMGEGGKAICSCQAPLDG
jgi:membrane protein YdbS with pleckstrin-like domain